MTNHYHLVVKTPEANLSVGMRQLNGVYTMRFNHQYDRVGHLFQGRYKSILVDKSAYLLESSRYVVLNPVRAQMVGTPDEWDWSSYLYTLGLKESPPWLATNAMLLQFSSNRLVPSFSTLLLKVLASGCGTSCSNRYFSVMTGLSSSK